MNNAPTDQLTLEHFAKWLDGQIALGVALHVDSLFYDRYLNQHPTKQPDERLKRIFRPLPRQISAARLKEIIEQSSGHSARSTQ